jgi:hypothetical protein
MIGLPDLSNVPEVLQDKLPRSVAVVGAGPFDKYNISHLFRYLYNSDNPNPVSTPYINRRLDVIPHYRSSSNKQDLATWLNYIYWPSLKIGFIGRITVSNELKRHGIMTAMRSYYRGEIKKAGITDLYTMGYSQDGKAFMSAMGWTFIEIPGYTKNVWGHITT